MIRSLFTAIGGLRNHQVMLDVTANNISNVNTVGYKSQRASFESMMSQTLRGAGEPTAGGVGGTNPTQVGLGMTLGGVSSVLTQGSTQTTGQWSDVAISGDGYFIVADSADAAAGTVANIAYTRAGNFTTDRDGNLLTTGGKRVLGRLYDDAGTTLGTNLGSIAVPSNAQAVSVASDGTITAVVNGTPKKIAQLQLAKFPNPGGLERVGGNLLQETQNSGRLDPSTSNVPADATTPPPAGAVLWGAPSAAFSGIGSVAGGQLEMSNVDLAAEFTQLITAQRGFQANGRTITTSDSMLEELVNLKR
jgi:flagellar hook protein FlgE